MNFLATTAAQKFEAVPMAFWLNLLIAVGAVVLVVMLVRHAARMNKVVLSLAVFLFLSIVCFNWVYERNEPRVLTPIVNKIAPFLPNKLTYHG